MRSPALEWSVRLPLLALGLVLYMGPGAGEVLGQVSLRAGDAIIVEVDQRPELSGRQVVQIDGRIVPEGLRGMRIPAEGRTTLEIAAVLTEVYREILGVGPVRVWREGEERRGAEVEREEPDPPEGEVEFPDTSSRWHVGAGAMGSRLAYDDAPESDDAFGGFLDLGLWLGSRTVLGVDAGGMVARDVDGGSYLSARAGPFLRLYLASRASGVTPYVQAGGAWQVVRGGVPGEPAGGSPERLSLGGWQAGGEAGLAVRRDRVTVGLGVGHSVGEFISLEVGGVNLDDDRWSNSSSGLRLWFTFR